MSKELREILFKEIKKSILTKSHQREIINSDKLFKKKQKIILELKRTITERFISGAQEI